MKINITLKCGECGSVLRMRDDRHVYPCLSCIEKQAVSLHSHYMRHFVATNYNDDGTRKEN